MMARTQITLDPEDLRKAQRRSAELGISLAAYVRGLVKRDLDDPVDRAADVRSIFDVGDSGGSDVARHKDRYVGEAVEAEADRTNR